MTNEERRRRFHEFWEEAFVDHVRELRQQRGWSQQDLSDRLAAEGFSAMSQTVLTKIERGQRPLRVAEASALASALGIPPLSVFYGPAEDDQPEEIQELQKELMRAQKALDAAESKLDDAGFSYTSRYREAREAAAKLIAAKAASHQPADEGVNLLTGRRAPRPDQPSRVEAGGSDNLFAAGGYQPLDDYGPD
ncbi:helix-turn-helix transcriptional regulator [Mycolicibacterium conceptionense]|uniref:helix-turn-helix domain-containing protein n=1 Tax=Mycolicibacterium conceptionense TaxID=451644 RepID=UPI00336BA738